MSHSSEKNTRGLCLLKLSCKILQNFLYLWNKKTQKGLFFISSAQIGQKTSWVFFFKKYISNFWSTSIDNDIKHKPLISEEWWIGSCFFPYSNKNIMESITHPWLLFFFNKYNYGFFDQKIGRYRKKYICRRRCRWLKQLLDWCKF